MNSFPEVAERLTDLISSVCLQQSLAPQPPRQIPEMTKQKTSEFSFSLCQGKREGNKVVIRENAQYVVTRGHAYVFLEEGKRHT